MMDYSIDYSSLLISWFVAAGLYLPIPVGLCSLLQKKNRVVEYKVVVVLSTILIFFALSAVHFFTDFRPANATAALVYGAIAMVICKNKFGEKPDSGESSSTPESQQQHAAPSPSDEQGSQHPELSAPSSEPGNRPPQLDKEPQEKPQEPGPTYPGTDEIGLSGAPQSERAESALKKTMESFASLTPDERELLLKILEVLQEMPTKKKKRRSTTIKPWMVIALCGILFLALAFAAVYSLNKNPGTVSASHVSDATPSPLPSPTPFYKIYPFPNNGTYFNYTSSYPSCPLTITMPADAWHQYYYFVLKSAKGKAFTIYGHAGETIDIRIPAGYYTLYCASGHTWYGTKSLFGESGDYFAFDDVLIFHFDGSSYNGYEINLSESPYGNFEQHTVSADDFPE